MTTTTKPKPQRGALALVAGHARRTWRITEVDTAAKTVDLTCLNSFERLDFRGVSIDRITVVWGFYG